MRSLQSFTCIVPFGVPLYLLAPSHWKTDISLSAICFVDFETRYLKSCLIPDWFEPDIQCFTVQPVLEIPPRLKNKPVPDQIIKSVNSLFSSCHIISYFFLFYLFSCFDFKLFLPHLTLLAASTSPTTCSVSTTPDQWGKDPWTPTMSLLWVGPCGLWTLWLLCS